MTLARAVEAEELRPSLESLGWEVLVAADEAAGMEVLGGRWPDVILTDRTASAALWRAAVQDDSVVIVLADETDDISQGYVNGADLVLFRPLDVERLVFFRRYSA